MTDATIITIKSSIHAPIEKVWSFWNNVDHIVKWNTASPDWHTPKAENDLKIGGKFNYRMEAKDGTFGFDFWGIYDVIKPNETIEYTAGDGRKVKISFTQKGEETLIVQDFEAENVNSIEQQKTGWQTILDNFKQYVEAN